METDMLEALGLFISELCCEICITKTSVHNHDNIHVFFHVPETNKTRLHKSRSSRSELEGLRRSKV